MSYSYLIHKLSEEKEVEICKKAVEKAIDVLKVSAE
jgi:hypothetical protein